MKGVVLRLQTCTVISTLSLDPIAGIPMCFDAALPSFAALAAFLASIAAW